eukprot:11552775-Heterocapsa_arctica.AAC.1
MRACAHAHQLDVGHCVGLEQYVPLVVDLLLRQLRNVPHALAIIGRASARGRPNRAPDMRMSSSM